MNNLVSETRSVDSFRRISLHGAGNLDIQPGDRQSLVIEARPDVLAEIRTEVRDGELIIRQRRNSLRSLVASTGPIYFHLTVTDLDGIQVSGAAIVTATRLATEEMRLGISGAAKVDLELAAQKLRATISGAGSVKLAGEVDEQDLTISGSGAFEAAELTCSLCRVGISGAGRATVNATERLDANLSGSGSVKYLGRPVLHQRISGAGCIRSVQNREPELQGD